LPAQSRAPPLSRELRRDRVGAARSRAADPARRRQRLARLPAALSGWEAPRGADARAALFHRLVSVAAIPARLRGIPRRRPGMGPGSPRRRAGRNAREPRRRPAPDVAAIEQPASRAYRSRDAADEEGRHRRVAADGRDEALVLIR